jgi:hypothetical protein
VGGNFNCNRNHIETLKGGPIEVGGSYDCSNNKLISLKGMPHTIKDNFWCNHNQLTTLDGCAQVINGSFYADYNKLLTSLKGAPKYVGISVHFVGCTKLTSLKNIHLHFPEIHGAFIFTNTSHSKKNFLGLLKIRGLKNIILDDFKLADILRKHLKNGNVLACALELIEAGYEEQAKL